MGKNINFAREPEAQKAGRNFARSLQRLIGQQRTYLRRLDLTDPTSRRIIRRGELTMKKYRTLLTLGSLVLMASTFQHEAAGRAPVSKATPAGYIVSSSAQAEWKEFSPKQGGFSILMPGEPQEQTDDKEFPIVGKGQVHLFSIAVDSGFFLVAYVEIPGLAGQTQEFCDGFGKGFLKTVGEGTAKGAGGKVVKDTDITMGNSPGKEILIRVPTGLATARAYFIKRRGYQLIAAPSGPDGAANVKKFLDSFRLIVQ